MSAEANVVSKVVAGTVAEVVARFVAILEARQVAVFAVIDQAEAARGAGLALRDTVLVIFGNPAAGTPVMDAVPLAALDLPLKVLVWEDDGTTKVSYYTAEAIAERHGVPPDLVANLRAIDVLTDALVTA